MKLTEGTRRPQAEKHNDHQPDDDQASDEIALFRIQRCIHRVFFSEGEVNEIKERARRHQGHLTGSLFLPLQLKITDGDRIPFLHACLA